MRFVEHHSRQLRSNKNSCCSPSCW
jgi:hypothetical protein